MERKVGLGGLYGGFQLVGAHRLLNNQPINGKNCIHLVLPRTVLNSMGKMTELLDTILMSIQRTNWPND